MNTSAAAPYRRRFQELGAQFVPLERCTATAADTCIVGRHLVRVPQQGAGGVMYAMVGPPARGKSATYNTLRRLYQPQVVEMINAGDVRRVWEKRVLRLAREQGVEAVVESELLPLMDRNKVTATDVEALHTWLGGGKGAVPGDVFGKLGKLNNAFAAACIHKALDVMAQGGISFFDATNTDAPRRQGIIKAFMDRVQTDPGEHRLIFVENVCLNRSQLKRNFASKLEDSSDYKDRIAAACGPVSVANLLDADATDLLDMPDMRGKQARSQSAQLPWECVQAYKESMADITTRDLGYLNKYVPLHADNRAWVPSSTPWTDIQEAYGAASTCSLIDTYNTVLSDSTRRHRIGWMQLLAPQCRSARVQAQSQSAHANAQLNVSNSSWAYRGNVDPNSAVVKALLAADIRSTGASYGQDHRAVFDYKRQIKQYVDAAKVKVGGGKRYAGHWTNKRDKRVASYAATGMRVMCEDGVKRTVYKNAVGARFTRRKRASRVAAGTFKYAYVPVVRSSRR